MLIKSRQQCVCDQKYKNVSPSEQLTAFFPHQLVIHHTEGQGQGSKGEERQNIKWTEVKIKVIMQERNKVFC